MPWIISPPSESIGRRFMLLLGCSVVVAFATVDCVVGRVINGTFVIKFFEMVVVVDG